MSKKKITIVDDDSEILNSLKWLLESVGHQTETYSNPQVFLDAMAPDEISCLILDVRMLNLSGLELQEELIKSGADIPIIFISGHSDVPIAVRALKNGAFDFLTKPVNNQKLLESINRAIKYDKAQKTHLGKKERILEREQKLTPRERETMVLMVNGKLSKVIAHELSITQSTVEAHRANVMKKMQAKTFAELVYLVATYLDIPNRATLRPSQDPQ